MKYFVILIALLFTIPLTAQEVSKADLDSLQAIMQRQSAAWNRGDIDGFMHGYWESDSMKFIGKDGIRYGYQSALARYKKSYPGKAAMGHLSFTLLSAEYLCGNEILMTGRWSLERENDNPNGIYTLIWRKIRGTWVIIFDHSS